MADKKTDFFGWGTKKYTKEQIADLLEEIKKFNCGAIDEYLSKHVDNAFAEWLNNLE